MRYLSQLEVRILKASLLAVVTVVLHLRCFNGPFLFVNSAMLNNKGRLCSKIVFRATKFNCPFDIKDSFKSEAMKSWAQLEDGSMPGFIANMLPQKLREANPEAETDQVAWKCSPDAEFGFHTIYHPDFDLAEEWFEPISQGLLLDIGCGEGRVFTRRFTCGSCFRAVLGLDISFSDLQKCREQAQEEGIQPSELMLGVADANSLPLADHSVDAVVCSMLLHVVDDPEPILREIYRVLKPGEGRLFAAAYIGQIAGIYTDEGLQELLQDVGFTEVSITNTAVGASGPRHLIQAST